MRRIGNFSLFNFWRNPGWRLGTSDGPKNRYWYVASTLSLLIGLIFEWEDIIGGASLTRIVTIWIVVSGVMFYFLIRLKQTAIWSAIIAASTGLIVLGWQIKEWFSLGVWPGWDLGLAINFIGIGYQPDSFFARQLADFSLIGGLIGLAIMSIIILKAADRLGEQEANKA